VTDHDRQAQHGEWLVHGERSLYESDWLRLLLVDVELPDGSRFEHHVIRLKRAAITAVIDDRDRVLMMWRHRFVPDRWGWELPGGLVEDGEDPAVTAAREVEEETGWRARTLTPLVSYQPMVGMVDSEHLVFVGRGADLVGEPAEQTEAARTDWIPLNQIPALIAQRQIWSSGTLVALLHILWANCAGSADLRR
jgi:8-oxo-dGDP phosphatase